MGWDVIINQSLPNPTAGVFTANSLPILFGDFKRAYLLRVAGSPFIKRLDERYMDTLETGFIGFVRVGGVALNQTNAETGEPAVSPVVSLKIAAS